MILFPGVSIYLIIGFYMLWLALEDGEIIQEIKDDQIIYGDYSTNSWFLAFILVVLLWPAVFVRKRIK